MSLKFVLQELLSTLELDNLMFYKMVYKKMYTREVLAKLTNL